MRNPDNELQDLLNALESGQDLESILQGLPDEAQEHSPLLQLVSQIQHIQHPEPSPAQAARQQHKVLSAAREIFAPRRTGWKWPAKGWALSGGLVGAMVLVMAFMVIAAAGSFAAITVHNWTTVKVVEAAGVLQVLSQDQPERWQTIQSGERMREGERIRTSTDGAASLRFPDGSQIVLGPQTDLSLLEVRRSWDGKMVAVLLQHAGDTLHDVIPLKTSDSLYQVRTPSGTANVTGTNFGVTVNQASGSALFAVTEGSVWVESAGENVLLETGQATITRPGMAPDDPAAYDFQIKGILNAWDEDTLVIGDIQMNITEDLLVQGKPAIGEMARAAGHIDETGQWWADLLTSSGGQFQGSFTGILEATGETVWQVSGTSLLIDADTKLTGVMEIGDAVKVDFSVQDDGQYLAIHIRPHGEEEDDVGEEKEEPTRTPLPEATPKPSLTPSSTPTPEVTLPPEVIVTPTPSNEDYCSGDTINPTGMTLAERFGVSYEEIMSWFCQGYGFGEIELAYSLSQEYDVPVSEIFAMRSAGMGWGEIKQKLEDMAPTPTEKVKETKPTKTEKVKDKDK